MAEYDDRVARRRQERTDLAFSRIIPKPGPKMASAVIWWAFGLYALFYARAPYQPTPEEEGRYSELMQRVVFSEEAREAQAELAFAQQKLDEVNVFFWRWRSPYDRLVPPRQEKYDIARDRFAEAMRAREEAQSQAKATVGIWSQHGLDEARDRFWQAYQSGKDFAKRMTFWDVVFGVGGRNRDEEWFAVLLKWIGQIIMNVCLSCLSCPMPDTSRPVLENRDVLSVSVRGASAYLPVHVLRVPRIPPPLSPPPPPPLPPPPPPPPPPSRRSSP